MALQDLFINRGALRDERDQAISFAEERYDPSTLAPQVNLARERAIQGIPAGQEDIQRQRALQQLFQPQDTAIYGGNQARAIAGQQQRSRQQQQAFSDFQSRLSEADIQAQQQGQQQFAQARGQQRQIQAQQDAAIEQARLQHQQELERRRQKVGSTIGNVVGTAAGFLTGNPAIGAAAGGGLGAIFGGGGGAMTGATAGLSTGMQQQRNEEFLSALRGTQIEPQGGTTTTTATQTQQTSPSLAPETQANFNFMEQMLQGDFSQPQQQQTQQQGGTPQTPQVPPQQPQEQTFYEQIDFGGLGFEDTEQMQQEPPLSFEEFQQQQGFEAISNATAFGGYGQQGEGEGMRRLAEGTGDFLYDFFSAGNNVISQINPLNAINNIIRERQRRQYEQYLQQQ